MTLNCTRLFIERAEASPNRMALWLPSSGTTTFAELHTLASRAQSLCRQHGVQAGDSVLLAEPLGPRLYALVLGILASGASVVLVEPWMPVTRIHHVVADMQPKLFMAGTVGKLWGLRVPAIRRIPAWVAPCAMDTLPGGRLSAEGVDPGTPGIITFTSGTSGVPKGVLRHQGYMVQQHRVLAESLGLDRHQGADLCIFANFALANLASGRGSVIVPPAWGPRVLRSLDNLPHALAPHTLTCGPGFLLQILQHARLPSLRSLHVGGALTDCWIFEAAMQRWPDAHMAHLYGSSEAEPVALADAREAVRHSRARGHFQTLYLGQPVDPIDAEMGDEGVWVAGPHVCPRYIGNEEENRLCKRVDDRGATWHFMGDRVQHDAHGWWYGGRSAQQAGDFALEQRIYSHLQRSSAFVHRDPRQQRWLVGSGLKRHETTLLRAFPELQGVAHTPTLRDARHRARIDRCAMLKKASKGRRAWIVG